MTDVIRDVADLRAVQAGWRQAGHSVGLVPTMGALHRGHLSLARRARSENDRVIATIFVNPTQFGANEDLDTYPNTFDADLAALREIGVDMVFAPSTAGMYPDGFATRVMVSGLTEYLCGAVRPGHFDGVSQVVAKLLNLGAADRAYFGEKDWQQLAVIRRMALDLNFPTRIVGVPTVRAADGLALSSRNAYLTDAERAIAPGLYATLTDVATHIADGRNATAACKDGAGRLVALGFSKPDYLDCRDAATLQWHEAPAPGTARVFAAAHLGRARLIDNVPVGIPVG